MLWLLVLLERHSHELHSPTVTYPAAAFARRLAFASLMAVFSAVVMLQLELQRRRQRIQAVAAAKVVEVEEADYGHQREEASPSHKLGWLLTLQARPARGRVCA